MYSGTDCDGRRSSQSPAKPIGLHSVHVRESFDPRDGWWLGRVALLARSTADIERKIVDESTPILGRGGIEAKRDVAAIAINRWRHSYAYAFNSLCDRQPDPAIATVAKARFEALTIANSGEAWSAHLQFATDEGRRAVGELVVL
jgi:hypothetical protein